MSHRTPKTALDPGSAKSRFAALVAMAEPSSGRLSTLPHEGILSLSDARERAARATRRLAADRRIRLVFLYGSAAARDRETVGDVDLAILTRPALTLRQLLALRAEVAADAGPGLDLVSLNEASVVLAWEVVQHGECLYAADPSERLEFVTRAQSCYWDFRPFLETQWHLTGQRIEKRRLHGPQA